ncbi:hypothetical protein P7K49_037165 [Saguinus oedipus]|uniref:Uncharacterized protein n=1 Tax=Saguinus oedipus TaxID=9490 RepID=A0ABQ9THA9_SAGOE|nr:hypothetical protein P7K49_037165 [Saguinus oedipus]
MALVRGAELAAGPSRWLPTPVQVTLLRGKSSGAGSTSDTYTVIQPPPGALDDLLRAQEADPGQAPLTHRVGKFLGQATVALDEVFGARRAQHTQWYKLHSKAGKKEKERGPASESKIKDKMKGKKKYDMESASAILPSSAIEDPDLGSLGKMGKAKDFFLCNKLRMSSLTQSSTFLGSDSTLSSASGSLAYQGPGAKLLTCSPSLSSWLSTKGDRESPQSPKLFTHKRTYSDEASQIRAAPPRALLDLQGHLDAASHSSLHVNGNHIYNEEPQAPVWHWGSI